MKKKKELKGGRRFERERRRRGAASAAAAAGGALPEMLRLPVELQHCRGCGSRFQIQDQRVAGFVDADKLKVCLLA